MKKIETALEYIVAFGAVVILLIALAINLLIWIAV